MKSKELSIELQDRIVLRHRSGEGYQKMSAALKVPKNTVASIILYWKKFGTTETLPRAGRLAKLCNLGRRALVREVTRGSREGEQGGHSDRVHLWRRTFQKDNHLCSIPPIMSCLLPLPLSGARGHTCHHCYAQQHFLLLVSQRLSSQIRPSW
jgi:hypothetical protein